MNAPQTPTLDHVSCLRADGYYRMAYTSWGDPQADHVILCVHGLSRQGRDFDNLARALCQRHNVRVVCPDVLGRGRSQWLREPSGYQIPAYVSDMSTLLARLQAGTLDWVGTSMGGLIGMGVASLPGQPIRRLVLNDVGPVIEFGALQRIGTYLGQRMAFVDAAQAMAHLSEISVGFGPHTPEQWQALSEPMLVRTADGVRLHYDPAIAQAFSLMDETSAAAGQAALWAAYEHINCPTLLIRGADSDLLSASTAQAMTQRGPRAVLRAFNGVGHAPTLVAADQIQTVADFLLA